MKCSMLVLIDSLSYVEEFERVLQSRYSVGYPPEHSRRLEEEMSPHTHGIVQKPKFDVTFFRLVYDFPRAQKGWPLLFRGFDVVAFRTHNAGRKHTESFVRDLIAAARSAECKFILIEDYDHSTLYQNETGVEFLDSRSFISCISLAQQD